MTITASSTQIRGPRILHLSAVDFGGAGAAALRLHKAMCERGIDSILIVWESRSDEPKVITSGKLGLTALRRWAGRAWYRATSRRRYSFRDQQMRCLSRRQLVDAASHTQPDLIIVHYVSDFLSFGDVALLQKLTGARVAFHLLDMGLLTGGCHYTWGCQRYRAHCGRCPALPAQTGRDASARVLARKIAATSSMDHVVVVPSMQMAKDSEGAVVFEHASFHRILIGVDAEKLGRSDLGSARDALGIHREGVLLLFGAQELNDPRKGVALLFDALRSLKADNRLREREVSLLVVGNSGDLQPLHDLQIPVHVLGYVGADTLAQAYCAADFFLCPSVEDSGPMMVNEAMMSGTPVVGFPIGVLPDLVVEGQTGALSECVNAQGLAAALSRVLDWDAERRRQARRLCRTRALEHCSLDVQVRSFAELAPARI